jgi:DNA (cytosine-5)-methyltransferase 1
LRKNRVDSVAAPRSRATKRTGRRVEITGKQKDAHVAWAREARERGDFCHPPRSFPEDVREWRERLTDRALAEVETFPATRGLSRDEVRAKIDEGLGEIREIARLLELVHGSPRLGNKNDPVDELVYIILSRKTRESAYQATYDALKRRFARWEDLLAADRSEVAEIIGSGGLGEKKTVSLFGALEELRTRFGKCTLAPARRWTDDKLEQFLCSLPELSRKSAYCVMMYSMGRKVFPVDTHVGRVLQRVGIFSQLGLSLDGQDHKQLQGSLADVVPPNLRYSLHVNLVTHGRDICLAQSPACDRCEIRNFCRTYRERSAATEESGSKPLVIDLFAGAGGLSEGFVRAGFRLAGVLDSDPVALRTHRFNHPALRDDAVICRDIRDVKAAELKRLLRGKRLDVLIGAPPCQGFSMVGFRSKMTRTGYRLAGDERNELFEFFIDAALQLEPTLVLMENVPGMRTARRDDVSYLDAARRMLERGGYRATIWKLNATAFGVPQDRTRCFLVASRGRTLPAPPPEEYQDLRQHFDVDALPPVTLDEALAGMPPVTAGAGTAVTRKQLESEDPRARRYLAKFKLLGSSSLLYNHFARYNNARDLELYALLRPGEDSVHAVERHGRADLMRYRKDVFDDKYARMRGDRPSKTIVAHLAKDGNGYIHPREVRSITVREAARLQSFRDDYVFCGSPSDQWVQVGNAVPPLMSEIIARRFLRVLEGERR